LRDRSPSERSRSASKQPSPFVLSMVFCTRHSEVSSGEVVSMMQAVEPRPGNHFYIDRRSLRDLPTRWSFLVQTEMSSVVMIVANVLVLQAFQMAFVEYNHVVK